MGVAAGRDQVAPALVVEGATPAWCICAHSRGRER
jgi:hypothetical protein